jgi:hypothetical protein
VYGIIKILGQSSKPTTLLGIHTWERSWKYISNRWHIGPRAFPVNVAKDTFVKQAQLQPVYLHEHMHNSRESILENNKLWEELITFIPLI